MSTYRNNCHEHIESTNPHRSEILGFRILKPGTFKDQVRVEEDLKKNLQLKRRVANACVVQ